MQKVVDETTKEIILAFISEGHERLDDAEGQLGKLGSGDDDTTRLNTIFRLFHSLKGSAGFLNFTHISRLTHSAENLLTALIKQTLSLSPLIIDQIYQSVDGLRKLVDLVSRDFSDDDGRELTDIQVQALHSCMEVVSLAPTVPNTIQLSRFITRDMVDGFQSECLDLLEQAEKTAMGMASQADPADAINDIFRTAHTIKGNAGAFGYLLLESLCMSFEELLDSARTGNAVINDGFGNMVIARIDAIRQAMVTHRVIEADGPVPLAGTVADSPEDSGELEYKHIGEILVEAGAVKPEDLRKALELQSIQSTKSERGTVEEVQRKEIRVDTAKLDKLFDLVGELITAEAIVLNSQDLKGLKLDHFSKSFAGLNKISREIQETTMMIRMIPLEGLFQKMTRLVRDLTRKFNKPNNFRVNGQETEMDKNVIEQISDPLVHIIRNALDHGLESPAARKAVGKDEKGSITLDARYEGSEIWISIQDDGAGLNRQKILTKARERDLLKSDPDTMPDNEVWQLIFEPGFSTADVITDVSGRGVGMDVVKKNLERIRGQVDIHTTPGKGTTFILKIPLTMAIIDGITVRVAGNFYSIPLGDILEFFQATPAQLNITEKDEQTVNVRGTILPLVKLGEVFRIATANVDPTVGIILVVQSKGRKACLLIDEVVGNQQIVVKSLSEYLGRVDGISGCSILGDGMVSFIIDTGRLLSLRLE